MNPYILLAAALLCITALVLFHLETKRFIVKQYTIASRELPEEFCGTKLILISDLHNTVYGMSNQRLLSAIDQEKPDYILIAGDLLTAKAGEDFTPAVDFLRAVSGLYPVYYSYGNHESRLKEKKSHYGDMAREYERQIGKLPLHMLHNQKTQIIRNGASVWIYGLEIGLEYYRRFKSSQMTENYLNKQLGRRENDGYHILIAHNPFYFPAYAEWGADLVVSGHNHGGIARVPFLGGLIDPNLRLFPEYDRGVFRKGKAQMVLSAGTGSHSPNFRAFNPPELVVITLDRKDAQE